MDLQLLDNTFPFRWQIILVPTLDWIMKGEHEIYCIDKSSMIHVDVTYIS